MCCQGALGASPTTKVSDMDKDASAGEEYFDQTDGYRLWEATENAGCTGSQCDYAVELHIAESLISMPNNMSVLEGAHYVVSNSLPQLWFIILLTCVWYRHGQRIRQRGFAG